ncbi:MAG: sugar ABC transporter permease [Chloroflexota bacterium]
MTSSFQMFRAELRRSEVKWAYILLIPTILPLLIFTVMPVLGALGLSFAQFDAFSATSRWIGTQNYTDAFANDLFRITARNTLQFTVGFVPLSMGIGLIAALLLNRRFRGISFLRGAYYLPVLTSTIAMGIAWMWLFQPQVGLVSQIMKMFGGQPKDWLGNPFTAMYAVIGVAVWKAFGGTMLIYLAGLQGIPDTYYDAAQVDGASRWQTLRFITLPLLRPVTFYLFIIGVIDSLQVFDLVMIMTEGGPAFRTTTIVHQIYLNAFKFNQMGYASAMAVILFAAIAVLTFFNWKFFSSSLEY